MTDTDTSKLRPPLITLITAILLGSLLSMRMMATGLAYVAIFLICWLPYSLVVIVRNPEKRRSQTVKIGIWLAMVTVVLGIHMIRREFARDYAENIVQKIEAFQKTQGRYPNSLEEIGIHQDEFSGKLGLAHYSNKPLFYYPDTMMIFHMWSYDFDSHEWINESD